VNLVIFTWLCSIITSIPSMGFAVIDLTSFISLIITAGAKPSDDIVVALSGEEGGGRREEGGGRRVGLGGVREKERKRETEDRGRLLY
jgi:hypothetical protein